MLAGLGETPRFLGAMFADRFTLNRVVFLAWVERHLAPKGKLVLQR